MANYPPELRRALMDALADRRVNGTSASVPSSDDDDDPASFATRQRALQTHRALVFAAMYAARDGSHDSPTTSDDETHAQPVTFMENRLRAGGLHESVFRTSVFHCTLTWPQ